MSQPLRVLAAVHCAQSEGDRAQNSGNRRIRSWVDGRPISNRWPADRRIHRLLGRHKSRGRHGAFHACGQARLAVDHSANIAGALVAKWLAASAAESHRSNIAVCGAVHTNLLSVVTDTTGRSGFDGSRFDQSRTDGPSGALARIRWLSVWL